MPNKTTTNAAAVNSGRPDEAGKSGQGSAAGQPWLVCRVGRITVRHGETRLLPASSGDFRGRRGREAAPLLWGDLLLQRERAVGRSTEAGEALPDVLGPACSVARRLAAMRAFRASSSAGRGLRDLGDRVERHA